MDASQTVDRVARNAYGRLIAYLAARTGDVAAAEDSLAAAFLSALQTWPVAGVPERPEAWLLTTARRRQIDAARRQQVQTEAMRRVYESTVQVAEEQDSFPDERLKLLFTCAHPAIDEAVRTPLMLQAVLGLDAGRIANAFITKPGTMGQRLSRAKFKIREAKISFEIPSSRELAGRLTAVLSAIYAAYGTGWNDVEGADARGPGLAEEAIELGEMLVLLMPSEPEVHGLLALMLYCQARRSARRGFRGEYVPLAEQDPGLWSLEMIDRAEAALAAAASFGRIGRFQLEAAIQSAHCQRRFGQPTDWDAIAGLYFGLVRICPTLGAITATAAALGEARGALVAWEYLQQIPPDAVRSYQPYWALLGHLLARLGLVEDAREAYSTAIGLSHDSACRSFLQGRLELVSGSSA